MAKGKTNIPIDAAAINANDNNARAKAHSANDCQPLRFLIATSPLEPANTLAQPQTGYHHRGEAASESACLLQRLLERSLARKCQARLERDAIVV
jgi:hypothetical protein